MPPESASPPAELVGNKYRLERLLGEGGMASVWRAKNVQLDMPVAIKVLRPGMASEELSERLRAEARASANLNHPAIIRVFDIEEMPSGEPCIVMELLEGENLYERLERGPIGAVELVRLLLPIADALCAVHEQGFIHRDLKPENIFIAAAAGRVQPKLLDFGIAKSTGSPPARPLSGTGHVVGSPGYMSPEQACGAELDERTDVWSFCVVLYEALAGHPAFAGDTPAEVLKGVLHARVAPLDERQADAELTRIISNGLKKDRAARTPSLRALGAELARWLHTQGVREDSAGGSVTQWLPVALPVALDEFDLPQLRRPRWHFALAAVAGLASLATVAWAATERSAPPSPAPAAITTVRMPEPIALAPPPDLRAPAIRLEPENDPGAMGRPPSPASNRGARAPAPGGGGARSASRHAVPAPKIEASGNDAWGPTNPYGI